jgi:hypothetical protein
LIDWHHNEAIEDLMYNLDEFSPRLVKGKYLVQFRDKGDGVEIKLIDYLTIDNYYLHMLLHLN